MRNMKMIPVEESMVSVSRDDGHPGDASRFLDELDKINRFLQRTGIHEGPQRATRPMRRPYRSRSERRPHHDTVSMDSTLDASLNVSEGSLRPRRRGVSRSWGVDESFASDAFTVRQQMGQLYERFAKLETLVHQYLQPKDLTDTKSPTHSNDQTMSHQDKLRERILIEKERLLSGSLSSASLHSDPPSSASSNAIPTSPLPPAPQHQTSPQVTPYSALYRQSSQFITRNRHHSAAFLQDLFSMLDDICQVDHDHVAESEVHILSSLRVLQRLLVANRDNRHKETSNSPLLNGMTGNDTEKTPSRKISAEQKRTRTELNDAQYSPLLPSVVNHAHQRTNSTQNATESWHRSPVQRHSQHAFPLAKSGTSTLFYNDQRAYLPDRRLEGTIEPRLAVDKKTLLARSFSHLEPISQSPPSSSIEKSEFQIANESPLSLSLLAESGDEESAPLAVSSPALERSLEDHSWSSWSDSLVEEVRQYADVSYEADHYEKNSDESMPRSAIIQPVDQQIQKPSRMTTRMPLATLDENIAVEKNDPRVKHAIISRMAIVHGHGMAERQNNASLTDNNTKDKMTALVPSLQSDDSIQRAFSLTDSGMKRRLAEFESMLEGEMVKMTSIV